VAAHSRDRDAELATLAISFAAAGAPRALANLRILPAELQLLVDRRRARLTVREFELFTVLAERVDQVVQRPEVYDRLWGGPMPRRDRSVDVLVRKVRAKLLTVAPDWRYIHTHFGIGYRLSPERLQPGRTEPPQGGLTLRSR